VTAILAAAAQRGIECRVIELNSRVIAFAGPDGETFEDFRVTRTGSNSGSDDDSNSSYSVCFCKTMMRAYDPVVKAVVMKMCALGIAYDMNTDAAWDSYKEGAHAQLAQELLACVELPTFAAVPAMLCVLNSPLLAWYVSRLLQEITNVDLTLPTASNRMCTKRTPPQLSSVHAVRHSTPQSPQNVFQHSRPVKLKPTQCGVLHSTTAQERLLENLVVACSMRVARLCLLACSCLYRHEKIHDQDQARATAQRSPIWSYIKLRTSDLVSRLYLLQRQYCARVAGSKSAMMYGPVLGF
jgi:hypothetical protein